MAVMTTVMLTTDRRLDHRTTRRGAPPRRTR